MVRVFVAGATGYTGQRLVGLLTEMGVDVVAHVRPDSSRLEYWKAEFSKMGATVDSSAWTRESMMQAMETYQPTHVFALLGTTRARAKASAEPEAETYARIDYGLTSILLTAAQRVEGVRFVYLSSLGVKAKSGSSYLDARYRVETELRGSNLDWVVVRPAFISGPDRDEARPMERFGAQLGDLFLGGLGAVGFKRAASRYRSVSAATLSELLARAAQAEPNRAYMLDELYALPKASL